MEIQTPNCTKKFAHLTVFLILKERQAVKTNLVLVKIAEMELVLLVNNFAVSVKPLI